MNYVWKLTIRKGVGTMWLEILKKDLRKQKSVNIILLLFITCLLYTSDAADEEVWV